MTTLKVGGPARFFVRAEGEIDVAQAAELGRAKGLDIFVLGGGSNVLVSDSGFDGLVIQVAPKGISISNELVTAQAGEDWDSFVAFCARNDLAGVECLSGIPGFVGGTPVQNVGAYGQEVSETIVSVRCFDRATSEIVELDNAACGFSYRKSIFNSSERDRYIVLAVTYDFVRGGSPNIVYKDLQEFFDSREPTLVETRNAVLKIRRAKSMVIDESDPNSRSAGSFFKNPIVEEEKLAEIGPGTPHFAVDERSVKIPAAWLIENAGFNKGYVAGNAGISTNHSLAIINRGGATANEIIELKNKIQAAVYEKFGIELSPEPIFVGF